MKTYTNLNKLMIDNLLKKRFSVNKTTFRTSNRFMKLINLGLTRKLQDNSLILNVLIAFNWNLDIIFTSQTVVVTNIGKRKS